MIGRAPLASANCPHLDLTQQLVLNSIVRAQDLAWANLAVSSSEGKRSMCIMQCVFCIFNCTKNLPPMSEEESQLLQNSQPVIFVRTICHLIWSYTVSHRKPHCLTKMYRMILSAWDSYWCTRCREDALAATCRPRLSTASSLWLRGGDCGTGSQLGIGHSCRALGDAMHLVL